jgi:hypothetical protein
MRDIDVRRLLLADLNRAWVDDKSTRIVEELGLCKGCVRVDVAVVNGSFKGYEIKSERDTLVRLASQAAVYSRVFDTMTIVAAERHIPKLEAIVPQWWGIDTVSDTFGVGSRLLSLRREGVNPTVDPLALVQLLWRDEALSLLRRAIGSPQLFAKEPRQVIWKSLAVAVELSELKDMVRTCLKARPRWRADEPQKPDHVKSLPFARSSSSLCPRVRSHTRKYTHRPN